jgi:hypothetical protein
LKGCENDDSEEQTASGKEAVVPAAKSLREFGPSQQKPSWHRIPRGVPEGAHPREDNKTSGMTDETAWRSLKFSKDFHCGKYQTEAGIMSAAGGNSTDAGEPQRVGFERQFMEMQIRTTRGTASELHD